MVWVLLINILFWSDFLFCVNRQLSTQSTTLFSKNLTQRLRNESFTEYFTNFNQIVGHIFLNANRLWSDSHEIILTNSLFKTILLNMKAIKSKQKVEWILLRFKYGIYISVALFAYIFWMLMFHMSAFAIEWINKMILPKMTIHFPSHSFHK